jgi:hypothetical protein
MRAAFAGNGMLFGVAIKKLAAPIMARTGPSSSMTSAQRTQAKTSRGGGTGHEHTV